MKLLLDTHTLIWAFDASKKLSTIAESAITNPRNTNFVSIASFWEIAIKIGINKLEMDFTMEALEALAWENGVEILPIQTKHTFELRTLPFYHKDPFDRMIFAQASVEGMNLVSCDEIFDSYLVKQKIKRIW